MTAAEKRAWLRSQRRAASLSPEISKAILKSFADLKSSLSDAELARKISSGYFDAIIDEAQLSNSFAPVSEAVQKATAQATKLFSKDLPGVSASFNILNPSVLEAIRSLETKVVQSLKDDVRDVVLAHVENGLRDGVAPKTIARDIKGLIGLGPSQLEQVGNYRDALEGKNGRNVNDYTLRDKRFKGELTPEKIDRMVETYQSRRISQNAETIARTASLDAMKKGQALSIDKAVEMGVYDPNALVKSWKGVLDDREREEHLAMEGETVPYDALYSNGEDTPGESTFNCRCVSFYHSPAA
jgi:hypothetical protein